MYSIRQVLRIGRGPSSSHTMGPERACKYMKKHYPEADRFRIILYGSLAKTGKGHMTDFAISETLKPLSAEILWNKEETNLEHPNQMDFIAFRGNEEIGQERIFSIGGGALEIKGKSKDYYTDIYPESTFDEIKKYCSENSLSLPEYVYRYEDSEIKNHLTAVWHQMKETVESGLKKDGVLPGGLNVLRRGKELAERGRKERNLLNKEHLLIAAYAYAACEENASGEKTVTSPTCGASGIVPAVLYYEWSVFDCSEEQMVDALAVAGLIGQLIKTNGSISGAEAGCQAEVGSATCMAAAALTVLHGQSIPQIECAAEMAMEHCLGLTCDPVAGLVQIPCIERNAVAALRAYNVAGLSEIVYENRKVSFDLIIKTMLETGRDLSHCYRETAEGGLAKYMKNIY